MWLALKYTLFAIIATAVNIGFQDITSRLCKGSFELYISMAVGTLAGLIVKYLLDKKYIFYHQTIGLWEDSEKFFLYTAMGVVTTLIFWGCEIFFDYLFHAKIFRYLGAIIGLSLGYWTKYQLDKRFVFGRNSLNLITDKNSIIKKRFFNR
ncbi:MAG: GtrA family protein [Deltaproteobacteria bacterium]|nr:GtrA family protein [Deltaproteobacteria bacterium]